MLEQAPVASVHDGELAVRIAADGKRPILVQAEFQVDDDRVAVLAADVGGVQPKRELGDRRGDHDRVGPAASSRVELATGCPSTVSSSAAGDTGGDATTAHGLQVWGEGQPR